LIEAMAVERGRTVPPLRQQRPDVPWSLESIARKCLPPDRDQRYQRAEHLPEDLRRFLEDRPLRYAPELSWRERGAKWLRRHPRLTSSGLIGAAAAFLLTTAATLLIGTQQRLKAAQDHVYEAEGVEARQRKQDFDAGHQRALYLVNTAVDGHEHVGQGLKVCESTLALYQVLERDDWQDQPAWRRLPTAEQKALAEEARDLLLLLAQARAHLASSPMRPEVSRLAGAFLVSLGCTPQAGTPSALTALSALGSERTAAEQL